VIAHKLILKQLGSYLDPKNQPSQWRIGKERASCIERWLSSVTQSSFFVLAFKLSTFDFVKNIVKSPSIADANAAITSIKAWCFIWGCL
jgi:hypothetical protein